MKVLITTTGTQSPVIIPDLDGIELTHPTTEYDLLEQFSLDNIYRSEDLQTVLNNGYITLKDDDAHDITDVDIELAAVSEIKLDGLSGGGDFGKNYAYNASENLSSTTSTSYQQKLRLSVTNVPAGNYRIGWFYEWRTSTQNTSLKIRVQLDDSTDLSRTEPSSNRGNVTHDSSGFVETSLNGNHNIDIDYASDKNGSAVYIGRTRLELWRVS